MSEPAHAFIVYLAQLSERDRGALATLRRSLAFDPGAHPPSYPFVERFVGADKHANDPWRKGLYLTAGLYALHPQHQAETSLASALARLGVDRNSGSVEQRFIALLGAEPEHLAQMLRPVVTLLASDGRGFDYVRLLVDTAQWLRPFDLEGRDRLRQRWARDFYRTLDRNTDSTPEKMPATHT
jgi:CRISPR system Cascade subunit CasB